MYKMFSVIGNCIFRHLLFSIFGNCVFRHLLFFFFFFFFVRVELYNSIYLHQSHTQYNTKYTILHPMFSVIGNCIFRHLLFSIFGNGIFRHFLMYKMFSVKYFLLIRCYNHCKLMLQYSFVWVGEVANNK